MNIKLSRSQWETVGIKAGWMKKADQIYTDKDKPCPKCGSPDHTILNPSMPIINQCIKCLHKWNPDNVHEETQKSYFKGWDARQEYKKGEHMILNPELRKTLNGRAFLRGWNDAAWGKPREIPTDLSDFVQSDEYIKIE